MASPFVRYGKAVKYEPEDNELREALIKLYESTNGDNWFNNTNWCSDKPITEWYGVYKIAENNYSLDLSDNNLTGKIDQTFPNDVKITLSCNFNQLTSLNVSGCTALNKLLCVANQLTFLDASGCTALTELWCYNNQLTSLDVSGCTSLTHLYCHNNKIRSVIPDWFSQLSTFNHDIRFRYWTESVPDGDGGYETIDRYEDRGIGWWYPGEPGKYEHSPD